MTLMLHLLNHEGSVSEQEEAGLDTLQRELNWPQPFTDNILNRLIQDNCIELQENMVKLTDKGRVESIRNYQALFR